MSEDGSQGTEGASRWLRWRRLGVRLLVPFGISFVYLAAYLVMRYGATHVRSADFRSGTAVQFVRIGSIEMSVARYETVMGTAFHPAAMLVFLLPAAAFATLLAIGAGSAVVLWFGGIAQRRRALNVRREEHRHDETMAGIAARANRPNLIVGAGPGGDPIIERNCTRCGRMIVNDTGVCPGCGSGTV